MKTRPASAADQGTGVFYGCAGAAAFFAVVLVLLGEWQAGIIGLAVAGGIGGHPYLRSGWYWVGYTDGYDHGFNGDDDRSR